MPFRISSVSSLAAALIVAFLTASLAPCPAPALRGSAHSHHDAARVADLSVTQACPCGCERVPAAGGSARLGAALLVVAPQRLAPADAAPVPQPALHAAPLFAASIDHVPLPASA